MRRAFVTILGLIAISIAPVTAQEGFGVGIVLGEPSGLTAKLWLTESSALDGVAAWSFQDTGSFYFHADYLLHFHDLIPAEQGIVPLYLGAGGNLALQDNPHIGARVPVGIEYIFQEIPVEIFLEAAPGIGIYPETELQMGGGLGVRFYF